MRITHVQQSRHSFAAFDTVNQCRQHALCPNAGFDPFWGFCILFSCFQHCNTPRGSLFKRYTSTFLPPFPIQRFCSSLFYRGFSHLRYYEGSVSCRVLHGLLIFFGTPNPSNSPITHSRSPCLSRINFRPFRPQPLDVPTCRFSCHFNASDDFLGFAVPKQARRIIPPNQVRIPTDWSFISSCSPPHLAVTQLLLISESWLTLTRTFTVLFMRLHRRTWASFHSAQPSNAGNSPRFEHGNCGVKDLPPLTR